MSIRRVIQIIAIAFALAFSFNASIATTEADACDVMGTGGWC
jgi:hypothetical protein